MLLRKFVYIHTCSVVHELYTDKYSTIRTSLYPVFLGASSIVLVQYKGSPPEGYSIKIGEMAAVSFLVWLKTYLIGCGSTQRHTMALF